MPSVLGREREVSGNRVRGRNSTNSSVGRDELALCAVGDRSETDLMKTPFPPAALVGATAMPVHHKEDF